jgi:hypothetical protein
MDSTVLSPLLTPTQILPTPPLIPLDHATLLGQIKTARRNSILFSSDNTSATTNTYMADSVFDPSTCQSGPPLLPPLPSSMMPSTACTAFMIQTQTGNALLIPHSQGSVCVCVN